MAAMSTRALPRAPSSRAYDFVFRNISSASVAVIGARWKATSFITSTKMPPRPNISIGPNCGSRVMPKITSRPGRHIRST